MSQAVLIMGVVWLAVISPGADFAIVSRNSSVFGRLAGLASSAGIASGCWVHILYAIFGLALVLRFFPDFFAYIQLLGAAYLIYLGVTTILAAPFGDNLQIAETRSSFWPHYRTGLLTNSLNPKTSIFVISLYTQMIGDSTSFIQQLGWGAFISASHFIWFALIALFMSSTPVRSWILQRQRAFNITIGGLLVLLGAGLFLANNIGANKIGANNISVGAL